MQEFIGKFMGGGMQNFLRPVRKVGVFIARGAKGPVFGSGDDCFMKELESYKRVT